MRARNLIMFVVLVASAFLPACSSGEPSNVGTKKSPDKVSNINSASNSKNANKSKDPLKTEDLGNRNEVNKAETLKPIVLAYCSAINSGDDSALRSIYSQASWRALSSDAASEGQKSVAKFLSESEPVGKTCNVINERISGPVAEAVVITETYPKGVPLKFVKESGNWKMTNQSSDFDAVRKSSKK